MEKWTLYREKTVEKLNEQNGLRNERVGNRNKVGLSSQNMAYTCEHIYI